MHFFPFFIILILILNQFHVINSSFPFVCDEEWTRYGSKCYRIHEELVSFPDALNICSRSNLGELATITSKEEQLFLESYIGQKVNRIAVWVGGVRTSLANHDASFYWIGGQKFTYTNWMEGEPDNYNEEENCVAMNFVDKGSGIRWIDHRCDDHFRFLCQTRLNITSEEKDTNDGVIFLSEETERTYKLLVDVQEKVYERRKILRIVTVISFSISMFILIAYWSGQYKKP